MNITATLVNRLVAMEKGLFYREIPQAGTYPKYLIVHIKIFCPESV